MATSLPAHVHRFACALIGASALRIYGRQPYCRRHHTHCPEVLILLQGSCFLSHTAERYGWSVNGHSGTGANVSRSTKTFRLGSIFLLRWAWCDSKTRRRSEAQMSVLHSRVQRQAQLPDGNIITVLRFRRCSCYVSCNLDEAIWCRSLFSPLGIGTQVTDVFAQRLLGAQALRCSSWSGSRLIARTGWLRDAIDQPLWSTSNIKCASTKNLTGTCMTPCE